LVSEELFDQVQRILNAHSGAGVRFRTHPHYLKGLLRCGRCGHQITLQRAEGRRGGVYYYFLCMGHQNGICDQPYVPVEVIEEAVADHYGTAVWLDPAFRAEVRAGVEAAIEGDFALTDQMRDAFTRRLEALSRKESYFLDLAAEEGWPKETLRAKVDELRSKRRTIRHQLERAEQQLGTSKQVFRVALELLDDPQAMYRASDETVRSLLNRAFFTRLYIDGRKVVGHVLKEPFNVLAEAHQHYRTYQSKGATDDRRAPAGNVEPADRVAAALSGATTATATLVRPIRNRKAATLKDDDSTDSETLIDWLQTTLWDQGWSKAVMVRRQGLEPRTR
jgi:site-specific DNA recombinase